MKHNITCAPYPWKTHVKEKLNYCHLFFSSQYFGVPKYQTLQSFHIWIWQLLLRNGVTVSSRLSYILVGKKYDFGAGVFP